MTAPDSTPTEREAGDVGCTCANDGNASRCPLHTQADYDASARAGDVGEVAATETWSVGDGRFAVIDYDERGVCKVTREAMHMILERAGFTQAEIPTVDLPTNGRERLRKVAETREVDL